MLTHNTRFSSAKLLIERIWFCQDHINDKDQLINWSAIDAVMSNIRPSRSEEARVSLAKDLYFSTGYFFEKLAPLDSFNQRLVLKALERRLPE